MQYPYHTQRRGGLGRLKLAALSHTRGVEAYPDQIRMSSLKCVLCGQGVTSSAKRDLCVCAACFQEQAAAEAATVRAPRPFEPPDEIVPGLYLGSEHSANELERMRALNIRSVIIAAEFCTPQFDTSLTYLTLPVDDAPGEALRPHFDSCHDFIDEAIGAGTACLVHCVSGISRSDLTH